MAKKCCAGKKPKRSETFVRLLNLNKQLILLALVAGPAWAVAQPPDYPHGFFVDDLRQKPARPAFYNLDAHRVDPFLLHGHYAQFIDFAWDREHGRIFFSARETPKGSFRIYKKEWPDGEERVVYQNDIGPFRFLVSPDGQRFALQIMGPAVWPTLAVHDWAKQTTLELGEGYSPDWSTDSQRLLFLDIPGSLPSYLSEYRVDLSTAARLLEEPVLEAAYTDDWKKIVVKTAQRAKTCDTFQLWNRRLERWSDFSQLAERSKRERCRSQREIGTFPGHQFFFFKEKEGLDPDDPMDLVVSDVWGGRLQTIESGDWEPAAFAAEETTLVVGQDPLYVVRADGTGGRKEIPQTGFIRPKM
jgi:hypothetical protein